MPHAKRIHVDKQCFPVAHHDIIGMVIAVQHRVSLRNGRYHFVQLAAKFLWQVFPVKHRPAQCHLLHIRHIARFYLCTVDLLEHVHIILER